ncbi:uncharacterized protein L3040_008388 [Drepanopeziza brunnea f. sp. 'multigermtubi']|uniref:uncharacterized protein n=1 Tax=Drepanopeziza brunnea f. sp. 'multigermtubi' TaxID=698441 RepID=UPI0023A35AE7|nr:hypothetical protein L3040_008388 [Drepanopeziza brunnea f. sp. 'multigermtubi']
MRRLSRPISRLAKPAPLITDSPTRISSPTKPYRSRHRTRSHLIMDDARQKEHDHDTHAIPPQAVCDLYKRYQRMDDAAVDGDLDVVDFQRGLTEAQREKLVPVDTVPSELIAAARKAFRGACREENAGPVADEMADADPAPCTIYEHKDFPGLRIFPSLLPPECQYLMLSSILHRDLSNPLHATNLSSSYRIPSPPPPPGSASGSESASASDHDSFFSYPRHSKNHVYAPLDPSSPLKPLNTTQFLVKKLRWLTLGSQYDWATRAYPPTSPTPFPPDVAALVTTLFQASFTPESGVVLLYSPKDFMPVHRDVSEACSKGLASFSLGCDGLFVVSRDVEGEGAGPVEAEVEAEGEREAGEGDPERPMQMCVLRLRSGDCVWMDGAARWCWHAMPKVLAGTCPEFLADWPAAGPGDGEGVGVGRRKVFEPWRGYMRSKRVNLSCRQVWG